MKKLMVIVALVAAVVTAKAACVDWSVPATSADVGQTVYLLTAISDFASDEALIAAAISESTVASAARGKYAAPKQTANDESVTKEANFYYAVISADKKSFSYVDASALAGSVYNPDNQESSSGTFDTINFSTISSGTTKSFGQAVPEPTSGLLLLLGMAGLALRRKQK